MSLKFKRALIGNILIISVAFIFSFFLRIHYLQNSEVYAPIRADAKEYVTIASNLVTFGVYSSKIPQGTEPPVPNTNRNPGYPFFLVLHMGNLKSVEDFISRVTRSQAVLSSISVVIIYLISINIIPKPWALLVALLTACSPHLIAMDGYLLTESLFTFWQLLAFYIFFSGWRKNSERLIVLSGVMFGLLVLIRPAALLAGPFVGLSLLVRPDNLKFIGRQGVKSYMIFLLLFVLTMVPFAARNVYSTGTPFNQSKRGWNAFLAGTYINLIYKNKKLYGYPYRDDRYYDKMFQDKAFAGKILKQRFLERPLEYIKWYVLGKTLSSWKWDMRAGGYKDVYVYPMTKEGFQNSKILKFVHRLMKQIHWPIFWAAMLLPFLWIFFYYRNSEEHKKLSTFVPLFLLLFHYCLQNMLLFPIPRYTVPTRPFIFLAAIAAIYLLGNLLNKYLLQRPATLSE